MYYGKGRDRIWKQIDDARSFYIYGAQIVAYNAYVAIEEVLNKKPEAFIVSSMDKNPDNVDNVPVIELNRHIDSTSLIIIATPENYHEDIRQKLKEFNLHNLMFLDTHIEYLIMSRYFQRNKDYLLLEDMELAESLQDNNKEIDTSSITMYMAKFHKDLVLKGKYEIPSWIEPIQVGAALTEKHIAKLQDNTGDNISHKNPKYSEMTAMYWAWKNRKDDYMGICHYRRMLIIDNDDIQRIKQNNINVVLPLPFVCYPDASGQYGRYISSEEQKGMFQALKDISPEYYKAAKVILKKPYLYNYNMFLADGQTFDDYCQWIFPILERAEELCEPEGTIRNDRYIGYIAEVLTAIYFLSNKDKLRIVHAEKRWMI